MRLSEMICRGQSVQIPGEMGSPGWRGSSLIHPVGTCPGPLKSGWTLGGWLLVALETQPADTTGACQSWRNSKLLWVIQSRGQGSEGYGPFLLKLPHPPHQRL